MRKLPIFLAFAAALIACASLETIPPNACGNGVIDALTEDCDSFGAACGVPGSGATACRLTCDRTADGGVCPTGAGCGADGICRQPTGSLNPASDPFSAGATTLLTGDFDDDGRTDLVGAPAFGSSASARVHFFDENAALATTVSIDVALRLPLVRDFDRDGIDDLGFGIVSNDVGAFGALSGRRDRSFSTILFPSVKIDQTQSVATVINIVDTRIALPQSELSALVLVEHTATGSYLRNINTDTASGSNTNLDVPFPITPAQIVGRPLSGIVLTPAPDRGCGDVVVGYNDGDAGKLVFASPCRLVNQTVNQPVRWATATDANANREIPIVIGGVPRKLTGQGVFLGRWDGDKLDDVFVEVASANGGAEPDIYVATSTGTGLNAFQPLSFDLPLALADLDGNGRDAVLPNGISAVETDGGAPRGNVRAQPPLTFAEARVGQFNSDAIPDVVVRYDASLDVLMFASNGDGRYTTFSVPSDQPVRAIESGDFDGDRILDIAFLQSPRAFDDADGSGVVELVIAYGKANGGPEVPKVIGRFTSARELHTLRSADSAVDNLAVVESIAVAGSLPTTSVTVLFGSGERQPIAPLFLSDQNAISPYTSDAATPASRNSFRVWDPFVLTAGALHTAGETDLVAFAAGNQINFGGRQPTPDYPFPLGFWQAQSDPTAIGRLATFAQLFDLSSLDQFVKITGDAGPGKVPIGIANYPILAVTGDIDVPADGKDEIVSFVQESDGGTTLIGFRATQGAGLPSSISLPDVQITGGDPISLGDVDGDGTKDLVVITSRGGVRKVLVYLHESTISAFVTEPIELSLPVARGATAQEPVAFAFLPTGIRANGNPAVSLAVVGASQLALALLRADRSGFDVRDETSLLGGTSVAITSVAAGDFDGDGVRDLAVADSGSIRILTQDPTIK